MSVILKLRTLVRNYFHLDPAPILTGKFVYIYDNINMSTVPH